MSRSRTAVLFIPLFALLLLPALSCKRGNLPGAPEGYNFRTAHVVWKIEGSSRGTMEEYLETSGYKEGRLHYKRFAQINHYVMDSPRPNMPPRTVDTWIINTDNVQSNVMEHIQRVYKVKLNLDQLMQVNKMMMWREILWGLIPRKDLTQDQRNLLRSNIATLKDDDLKQVGAKITPDTFLGHKVKRYEIPLEGGRAILLLYGDIPLKQDIQYVQVNRPVRKVMTATKFELNKPIPDAVITLPKSYKIVDGTKKIPGK